MFLGIGNLRFRGLMCCNILNVFELDLSNNINCFKIKINLIKMMLIFKDFSFFMIFYLIIYYGFQYWLVMKIRMYIVFEKGLILIKINYVYYSMKGF